ncbi:hypothetical protein LUW77_29150 [Streptomyces radiopugnans]|nr:hypothetical protein LUW77_29150 [Streptomyces radiopugnans]
MNESRRLTLRELRILHETERALLRDARLAALFRGFGEAETGAAETRLKAKPGNTAPPVAARRRLPPPGPGADGAASGGRLAGVPLRPGHGRGGPCLAAARAAAPGRPGPGSG